MAFFSDHFAVTKSELFDVWLQQCLQSKKGAAVMDYVVNKIGDQNISEDYLYLLREKRAFFANLMQESTKNMQNSLEKKLKRRI